MSRLPLFFSSSNTPSTQRSTETAGTVSLWWVINTAGAHLTRPIYETTKKHKQSFLQRQHTASGDRPHVFAPRSVSYLSSLSTQKKAVLVVVEPLDFPLKLAQVAETAGVLFLCAILRLCDLRGFPFAAFQRLRKTENRPSPTPGLPRATSSTSTVNTLFCFLFFSQLSTRKQSTSSTMSTTAG